MRLTNDIRLCGLSLAVLLLPVFLLTPILANNMLAEKAEASWSTIPLHTLAGAPGSLAPFQGEKATVLVFVSTECPVSNGYIPTLHELARNYGSRGVRLVAIHANADQKSESLLQHQRDYQITLPILRDATGKLAQALGVTHCPEVCVLDHRSILRYQGRIDDRYARRGGSAREARSRELQAALDALLADQPIAVKYVAPIGCPLVTARASAPANTHPETTDVTYSREVSRILQNRCIECHRAGGVAPFALTSYQQARAWAEDIVTFTANHSMPPWKAVAGYGEFKNSRVLTQKELEHLSTWVKTGCKEGDPKNLPSDRVFPESWTFGTPDLILEPETAYQLAADGRDVYRCFVLPTSFLDDRYVVAFEVLPGNRRVVHHVLAFLDTTGASARLDAADPGVGYSSSSGFPGFLPSGGLGGWAPGNGARVLPEGMARVLPKGAKVVMQVHYHPTGKPESDRTRLGLYFARKPVERAVRNLPILPPLGRFTLRIPPGATNYEVQTSITLPRDYLAIEITPHMHLLGKDMKVTATLPDRTIIPLIYVKDYDFNWQTTYQYKEPILLPAGTRLDMVAHFDNSEQNPANPSRPPREARWGEQTHDEMCIAFLEVAPARRAQSPSELQAPPPGAMLREVLFSSWFGTTSNKKRNSTP